MWKRAILLIVFSFLLGHFIYCNYVRVIGPNYLLKIGGYGREVRYCVSPGERQKQGDGCIFLGCPASVPDSPPAAYSAYPFRGFPFATNDAWNVCNDSVTTFPADDFDDARALNYTYLLAITYLFIWAWRKTARQL